MKGILPAIVVAALFFTLLITAYHCPVKANSNDFITFDSGITVYSPLNTTYYDFPLVLNVSLYGAGNMGGLDPQISMTYSIDGVYNGSVPLRSDGELHVVTNALGTVNLPNIPEGSHYLTLYYYGLNQRTYEPKYLSYIDTIYFSTIGQSAASSPTTNPTLTYAPSPTAISTPKPTLNPFLPTPTSSETPTITVNVYSTAPNYIGAMLIIVISATVIASLLLFGQHRKTAYLKK